MLFADGLVKKSSGVERVLSYMKEQDEKIDRRHQERNKLLSDLIQVLRDKQ